MAELLPADDRRRPNNELWPPISLPLSLTFEEDRRRLNEKELPELKDGSGLCRPASCGLDCALNRGAWPRGELRPKFDSRRAVLNVNTSRRGIARLQIGIELSAAAAGAHPSGRVWDVRRSVSGWRKCLRFEALAAGPPASLLPSLSRLWRCRKLPRKRAIKEDDARDDGPLANRCGTRRGRSGGGVLVGVSVADGGSAFVCSGEGA